MNDTQKKLISDVLYAVQLGEMLYEEGYDEILKIVEGVDEEELQEKANKITEQILYGE